MRLVEEERDLSQRENYILCDAYGKEREVGSKPPSLVDWHVHRWYPSALERCAYRLDLDDWVLVDHWIETWVELCRTQLGFSRTKALEAAALADPKVDVNERTRTRRAPRRQRAILTRTLQEENDRADRAEADYHATIAFNGGRGKVRARTSRDAASIVEALDAVHRSWVVEWRSWRIRLTSRKREEQPVWRAMIAARTRWIVSIARIHDQANILNSR